MLLDWKEGNKLLQLPQCHFSCLRPCSFLLSAQVIQLLLWDREGDSQEVSELKKVCFFNL